VVLSTHMCECFSLKADVVEAAAPCGLLASAEQVFFGDLQLSMAVVEGFKYRRVFDHT